MTHVLSFGTTRLDNNFFPASPFSLYFVSTDDWFSASPSIDHSATMKNATEKIAEELELVRTSSV
jgi:hypothetical protein